MWLADSQDPWVMDRLLFGGTDDDVLQRLHRYDLQEALVLAGGDHGYWAEARLCRRGEEWMLSRDSHRRSGGHSRQISVRSQLLATPWQPLRSHTVDIDCRALDAFRDVLSAAAEQERVRVPVGALCWLRANRPLRVMSHDRAMEDRFFALWQPIDSR